jgi:RNA polymerase sigma-70 factor (ECF subfamily)
MLYHTLSDCQLTDLLTGGDEQAFNQIYQRFWKKIYNESYKRVKDTDIAEDIVQDIFADLWIKRHTRKIENLNGYLMSAARYQVFMLYKKNVNRPAFEQPLELIDHPSLVAESIHEVKDIKDCITRWMNMQPEKRREVFRLKFFEDKSTLETSEVLNISQKTVQNQFTISLHSLRSTLSKLLMLL